MSSTLYNLVRVTSNTVGTGSVDVSGPAVSGFATPRGASVPDGATISYSIIDGANTEVGRSVFSNTTQTFDRSNVIMSIAGGVVGNTAISLSGANATVAITVLASDIQNVVEYLDTYTASGTWTKRAGLIYAVVQCIGGGGGGQGGSRWQSGTDPGGGAYGGAGGDFLEQSFDASVLGATVSVTVGAGGTGSAGATSTLGAAGNDGGASSFGTLLSASGGFGGKSSTLANMAAWFNGSAASGPAVAYWLCNRNAGGIGQSQSGLQVPSGSTYLNGRNYGLTGGGGACGGQTSSLASITGGSGGSPTGANAAAGGTGNGSSGSNATVAGGGGGAGGGGVATVTGGTGGNGAAPGGGGGGGGTGANNNGGAGGNGARGEVRVISVCVA